MLVQCWPNIKSALCQCTMFAWLRWWWIQPANTRQRPKVGQMLVHRLRRWPNIGPLLDQCLVFAIHATFLSISVRKVESDYTFLAFSDPAIRFRTICGSSLDILPPTNRRMAQPVTGRDWPITAVIQLLLDLGGRVPYLDPICCVRRGEWRTENYFQLSSTELNDMIPVMIR